MFQVVLYATVLQCFLALSSAGCQVLGPLFPTFKLAPSDKSLKPLLKDLNLIAETIANGQEHNDIIQPNKTSFSVQVTSADETLWAYHHTARLQGNYSDISRVEVSGDTVFRVGSVTKTFTVLALLLQEELGVQFDDPITKYLPELLEGTSNTFIAWKDITLRSLASQLSGIKREYGTLDITSLGTSVEDVIQAGFPPVSAEEMFPCGDHTATAICTRNEYLHGVGSATSTYAPNDQSSYSNDAFVLLGLALEKITGKPYEEAMKEIIFTPLRMSHSSLKRPADSEGIIPPVDNQWRWTAGRSDPTLGMFSSTNDLTLYLRSILNHLQLSEAKTNAWLKPHSFSPGLNSGFGMAWEIIRISSTSIDGRTIDLYGKGGGLIGYVSHIMLIPEYGIGVSILSAGMPAATGILTERIAAVILREIEKVLQEKSRKLYVGSYRATNLNSSIEIAMSESQGLYIKSWISNGTDFLATFPKLLGMPPVSNDEVLNNRRILVVPTNVKVRGGVETWRALLTPSSTDGIFSEYCFQNSNMFQYGGHIINEVLFHKKERIIYSVEFPALRVALVKSPASLISKYVFETVEKILRSFGGWRS